MLILLKLLRFLKSFINNCLSFSCEFIFEPTAYESFEFSVTVLGTIMLIIAAIFGVWALVDKICGRALEGITTVIIILIFIGSIMMISLGIIGYYVARIYEEIKGRPKYIVSTSCKSEKTCEIK